MTTIPTIQATLEQHLTVSSLCMQPVSVDIPTAARLVGISESMLRLHIRRGDLVARYSGTKPLVYLNDLRQFVLNLPTRGKAL